MTQTNDQNPEERLLPPVSTEFIEVSLMNDAVMMAALSKLHDNIRDLRFETSERALRQARTMLVVAWVMLVAVVVPNATRAAAWLLYHDRTDRAGQAASQPDPVTPGDALQPQEHPLQTEKDNHD
jgi:hypothetical protein